MEYPDNEIAGFQSFVILILPKKVEDEYILPSYGIIGYEHFISYKVSLDKLEELVEHSIIGGHFPERFTNLRNLFEIEKENYGDSIPILLLATSDGGGHWGFTFGELYEAGFPVLKMASLRGRKTSAFEQASIDFLKASYRYRDALDNLII